MAPVPSTFGIFALPIQPYYAQTLFVDEGSIQAQGMLLGLSGSGSPSPNAIKEGWIWGAESAGLAGRADSSVLGGIKGHGLSAPDPATPGTGK